MPREQTEGAHRAPGDRADSSWRERAVERSLRTARARAVSRSDRFLAAASELLAETGRIDFTVQDIVERSKMSLRSFYQHFGGKDELLLALFEEAIRGFVERLRQEVERTDDPIDQLHAYVTGLYRTAQQVSAPGTRALTIYHLQLAERRPADFAAAIAPQIDLLAEIVDAGRASGRLRSDIDAAALTMLLSETLISAAHMHVLGIHMTGVEVRPQQLWAFCLGAALPPGDAAATGTAAAARRAGAGGRRRR
ncbi:MAG: TetR/AcrR family transcriptional regulator [Acidimicrobiales bacterium]